jgi:hypothetical protein
MHLPHEFVLLDSLVVIQVKVLGPVVVLHVRGSVDLDSSQNSNHAIGNIAGSVGDDGFNHFLLSILERVGKFDLKVVLAGSRQSVGIRHQQSSDIGLLHINDVDGTFLGVGSSVNGQDMPAGRSGTSTACSSSGTATSLDGTDGSLGVNTNVGSVKQEAVAAVGNVGAHGSEGSLSSVGESGQTTHAEVLSVVVQSEGLFKGTSQLVAAQRSGDKSVGLGESSLGKGCSDLGNQSTVGQSLGENTGDLGL